MTPHEIQLSTVAGCIAYLAPEPKCKIAARKLMTVLRHEQRKLQADTATESRRRTAHNPLPKKSAAFPPMPAAAPSCTAWKNLIDGAAFVFCIVSWGFFLLVVLP